MEELTDSLGTRGNSSRPGTLAATKIFRIVLFRGTGESGVLLLANRGAWRSPRVPLWTATIAHLPAASWRMAVHKRFTFMK